jgi:divalent metal cation (Fe/Co/Zn/Cd) transporter
VNKPDRGRIAVVTRLHDEEHRHNHRHGEHGHAHGAVDPTITTSERGIWAVKWSFVGLLATALVQIVVVLLSGSVALLSDTIHDFGDAATAIPLGIAFALTRLGASRRFAPEVVEEIRHAACEVPGVEEVSEVRARWLGSRRERPPRCRRLPS